MIKQIENILETYKQQKTALDAEWSATEKGWREKLSPSYIQEIKPGFEAEHRKKEYTLRAATLSLIEQELQKVDTWANYLNSAVNTAALQEVKSLDGVRLSESQISALLEKYRGDYYTTAAFCEMVNKTRPDIQKISYSSPDDLLQVKAAIEDDCLYMINNFNSAGYSGPDTDKAVQITLRESKFNQYADALTTELISEPDLDRPAPLTTAEKNAVDYLFTGCIGGFDKKEKAAELVKDGRGGLVARSEYAKYLPENWETMSAPELTDRQKAALVGYDAGTPTTAEIVETVRNGAGTAVETL